MISRRRFTFGIGAYACSPLLAFAQQTKSVPRIGLLWVHSAGSAHYVDAFREQMRIRGYVDGKDIRIDDGSLVEGYDGLSAAARRLARENTSVIVVWGATALRTAHKDAPGIPIVMAAGSDPVKLGLVTSLARPGGNITGLATINSDLSGKRLELLRTIAPAIRRVAILFYPGSPGESMSVQNFEAAAQALKLEVRLVEVRSSTDIESAIAGIAKMNVQAIAPVGSTLFTANSRRIVLAVEKLRMPAIYDRGEFPASGGLMSYGVNFSDHFGRAAVYVDKILRGAKPGEIPIEQPTTFELAINLKTAKALGLKVPQSILIQATKVIE